MLIDLPVALVILIHGKVVRHPDSTRGEEPVLPVVPCLVEARVEVEIEEVLRGIRHGEDALRIVEPHVSLQGFWETEAGKKREDPLLLGGAEEGQVRAVGAGELVLHHTEGADPGAAGNEAAREGVPQELALASLFHRVEIQVHEKLRLRGKSLPYDREYDLQHLP